MNTAVILCGGSGTRMGQDINKIFIPLNGKPMILHTLEAFESNENINRILLVLRKEDQDMMRETLKNHSMHKLISVIAGGSERQHSVKNALDFLNSINTKEEDIVLIHNGANPLVTEKEISKSIEETKRHAACAVGCSVKDTIKIVEDSFAIKTPDRKKLYAMQTPQTARYWLLNTAMNRAVEDGFIGTDDASLIERLGHKVKIINASNENIKITTKDDLQLAESIIRRRDEKCSE